MTSTAPHSKIRELHNEPSPLEQYERSRVSYAEVKLSGVLSRYRDYLQVTWLRTAVAIRDQIFISKVQFSSLIIMQNSQNVNFLHRGSGPCAAFHVGLLVGPTLYNINGKITKRSCEVRFCSEVVSTKRGWSAPAQGNAADNTLRGRQKRERQTRSAAPSKYKSQSGASAQAPSSRLGKGWFPSAPCAASQWSQRLKP